MSCTMRAILVNTPGDASHLSLGQFEKPIPKNTEILVRVKAFALNRMDILQREGRYPLAKNVTPILGVEVSGVIDSVGKEVKGLKVGEAVFGLISGGAYAEFAVMEESMAMHKPDTLPYEEAAAIPETWFTAYQSLFFVGELKKGQNVLIHAGASGVGIAAIQLAKEAGANQVFVTVGSEEKIKFCESIGATKAINYKTTPNWSEFILQETDNKGVHVLIDVVGHDYWNHNMDSLSLDGHMVILAYMSGNIVEKVDLGTFLNKRIRVEGSNLRARSLGYQGRLRDEIYQHAVVNHFAKKDGTLKVFIDKVFNWEQIIEAHNYLQSNQSMGKIVVKITENQ